MKQSLRPFPTETPPPISRAMLIKELMVFAKPTLRRGLTVAIRDIVLYSALLAVIVFAPWLGLKIVASILLGIRMTSMYTLAHDASHDALVPGKRLNWVIALVLGVPTFQNYRMWTHDHNHVHHPRTNGDHYDFYRPMSKEQYDQLPAFKRWLERVYRSPNVIGLLFYWLIMWIPTRLHPNPRTPGKHRSLAWKYTGLLVAYHSVLLALLATSSTVAPVTAGTAVVLGWVVPTLIHFFVSSGSLYLMHTHPKLPWFRGEIERTGDYAPELCSIVLTTPDWFSKMVNNVYCHAAHHAVHRVPTYNLLPAQVRMNELLGNRLVVEPLSLPRILHTLRTCKLYDFDKHQWLDFDGKPTAPPINLSARGA